MIFPVSLLRTGRVTWCLACLTCLTLSCGNRSSVGKGVRMEDIGSVAVAERFKIEEHKGYKVLTVTNPWQGAKDLKLTYYLVKREEVIPSGLDSAMVIRVPVKSTICMSTTHVAMISALGETGSITGISGTGFVYDNAVRSSIEAGQIADVGYENNLNKELIIKISPDLLMTYGIGGESASYTGKLAELGVKVMFNSDYLETDPLGKAEWIRVFGALYCREHLADSIFRSEQAAYDSLKAFIGQSVKTRPKVLLGLPYKDTWYVSPGNSFVCRLISDSGGDYLWKDYVSDISMPMSLEKVYLKALEADFWLNTGTARSLEEISAVDPRLGELPCFTGGTLFNNNLRLTPSGGNDYWETGTVHPHLILADIASILHPELFREHQLFFYRKLDRSVKQ